MVVAALALALGMEWNRDNGIYLPLLIWGEEGPCVCHHLAKRARKYRNTVVLELVDGFPEWPTEVGECAQKVQFRQKSLALSAPQARLLCSDCEVDLGTDGPTAAKADRWVDVLDLLDAAYAEP